MTGRGAEPRLLTSNLNELLVKMYERRMIRIAFDDPTLPWLPRSFWEQEFEAKVQATSRDLLDMIEERNRAKRLRVWEDQQLEAKSVDELLDELDAELPSLKGDDHRLRHWGHDTMARSGGITKRPTIGNPQPSYDFQCYQCGRPITSDRGRWTDHGGRTLCDLTFVDPIDKATDSYWTDHQPKPWNGEEEDDDE